MSGYSMDLGNGFKDSDYSPRESPSGSESFRSLEQANASVSASAICDLGGAPVVYSKGIAYFQDVCWFAELTQTGALWRMSWDTRCSTSGVARTSRRWKRD